jgi:hypothetical protein
MNEISYHDDVLFMATVHFSHSIETGKAKDIFEAYHYYIKHREEVGQFAVDGLKLAIQALIEYGIFGEKKNKKNSSNGKIVSIKKYYWLKRVKESMQKGYYCAHCDRINIKNFLDVVRSERN